MDFDFTIKMKDMISYYLKCIDTELKSENLTAQEYFERYGINQFYKSKTNVYKGGGDGMPFDFVLKRAYELGYFSNPSDDILVQVDKELKTQPFPEHKHPIAESSADLD